jgi:arabinofuranosyltransferase
MVKKIDDLITPEIATKLALLLIAIFLLLGIKNSFIQDDAFISFNYAQNFLSGHGLTWNSGEYERVAGYTNFLWTIMIAAAMSLGLDPVPASMILGIFFSAGTLYFSYSLSLLLSNSRLAAILTLIILGSNYTFSSYMTGGLETQLQTCLVVATTYLTFLITERVLPPNRSWLALISVLFSLAVMTRLDTALICIVLYFFLLSLFRNNSFLNKRTLLISYLTIPGMIIVGTLLLWEYAYYGDILPNTYYIKATGFSFDTFKRGAWYIFNFLKSYFLIPFVLLGIFYFKRTISSSNLRIILIMIGLWLLYIVKVGGDFMEFRFLVPITPFIFILLANLILQIGKPTIQALLVLTLLAGSIHHAINFKGANGVESISGLNGHVVNADQDWRRVGIVLGELFSQSQEPVIIATTAAGAIPYYSKLPTIDMLGINDKWIARNCQKDTTQEIGHQCFPTLGYLIQRNVNILLMHPKVLPVSESSVGRFMKYDLLPRTSKIIDIPLNNKYKIAVLYMKQNNYIDDVVQRLHLRTYGLFQ